MASFGLQELKMTGKGHLPYILKSKKVESKGHSFLLTLYHTVPTFNDTVYEAF